MIQNLFSKFKQLQADPILRAWLIGRAFGKWPSVPAFAAHQPPYLQGQLPLHAEAPLDGDAISPSKTSALNQPIDITLPGETLSLSPNNPAALFDHRFDDIETELGAHRFAWLDAPVDTIDPAWTNALWAAWVAKFGQDHTGWAWHPYTAAERAINIINFATHHGWPGDDDETITLLAAHAPVIARQLEYFGAHDTSNHLANNGRGLFIIGAVLGLPNATKMGMEILRHEAKRIFTPTGTLREGSSHYHVLYARRYAECAKIAHAKSIQGANDLSAIADRAMCIAAKLQLPGGMPLIGDISPDIAPRDLIKMMDIAPSSEPLSADGWHRADQHHWHGLWHCAPDGWSQMPGHGHQDVGSFQLHWKDERIIVDAGRGAYGEAGDAARYRSAAVHNGLTIDGQDPYPPNKPYYTAAFRQSACGEPPTLSPTDTGVRLIFDGYKRMGHVGTVKRDWSFDVATTKIEDAVEGKGTATIQRQLVTSLPTQITSDGVVISGTNASFHIRTSTLAHLEPITIWHAYGHGAEGTAIQFKESVSLPWQSNLVIEVI